jgi:hypothetical protein
MFAKLQKGLLVLAAVAGVSLLAAGEAWADKGAQINMIVQDGTTMRLSSKP